MSSFFKKPSWAQEKTPSKPQDFFRRSNQVYTDFVATAQDDEDSEEDVAAKREMKDKPSEPKRRRISNDDKAVHPTVESRAQTPPQGDTDGAAEKDSSSKLESRTSITPPRTPRAARMSPKKTSPRKKSPLTAASPPGTIIRLNSESPPPPAVRVPPAVVLQDDSELDNDGDNDEESDEECAELVRRARERARNRSLQAESKSKSPTSKSSTTLEGPSKKTGSPSAPSTTPKSPKKELKDTVVTILITSKIENTRSLLVRRMLSQNLRDVRKAWCNYQNFDEEKSDSIILTWKGRRLFDATTCKSLGINESDNNDNSMFDSAPFDMEEGNAGVHMEAMTSETFEKRRRTANAIQDRGGDTSEEEPEVQKEPEGGDIVRMILKNPDLEDFKIRARPSTQIMKIITKFRETNDISSDISISLFFDGDRLDPETSVGDNDIDDMDCIDVVLK